MIDSFPSGWEFGKRNQSSFGSRFPFEHLSSWRTSKSVWINGSATTQRLLQRSQHERTRPNVADSDRWRRLHGLASRGLCSLRGAWVAPAARFVFERLS